MDSTENKPPEDSKLKLSYFSFTPFHSVRSLVAKLSFHVDNLIFIILLSCFCWHFYLHFSFHFCLVKCKKSCSKTRPTRRRILREAVHAELNYFFFYLSSFHDTSAMSFTNIYFLFKVEVDSRRLCFESCVSAKNSLVFRINGTDFNLFYGWNWALLASIDCESRMRPERIGYFFWINL